MGWPDSERKHNDGRRTTYGSEMGDHPQIHGLAAVCAHFKDGSADPDRPLTAIEHGDVHLKIGDPKCLAEGHLVVKLYV